MRASRNQPRQCVILTPEDLPITLTIAPAGERITAFIIDLVCLCLCLIVPGLMVLCVYLMTTSAAVLHFFYTLAMLMFFLIRNGYFVYFELRWQGVTPGKKSVGTKVVSRNGGPVTTGAVFSRNLLRELEFFLPMQALMIPASFYTTVSGWTYLFTSAWLLVFVFMPLFNRDRLRCGDLAAGTMVVSIPEARLQPDAALSGKAKAAGRKGDLFQFADEQLDMYGIEELQVLEDVLRRHARDRSKIGLLRKVCRKICRKIAWADKVPDTQVVPFLEAFYRAQRRRLEERLLLGERRAKKRKGRLTKP